jgi:hypothetical protein
MKERDVIRRIESDGWQFERQRGSHRIYSILTSLGRSRSPAGQARMFKPVPLGTSFDKRD